MLDEYLSKSVSKIVFIFLAQHLLYIANDIKKGVYYKKYH